MFRKILIAFVALALGACATTQRGADQGPTPNRAVLEGTTGVTVHWGGQIIRVTNLRDRTLVEVLAFPLDNQGRPLVDEPPGGRFIVERGGFLEPREYARDRLVEVRGPLTGFTDGRVGDAAYRYPVVLGDTLRLWEAPRSSYGGTPRVRPSIGIGIGSGSSGTRVGGGLGIDIGF